MQSCAFTVCVGSTEGVEKFQVPLKMHESCLYCVHIMTALDSMMAALNVLTAEPVLTTSWAEVVFPSL